jgi:hypothetical protein
MIKSASHLQFKILKASGSRWKVRSSYHNYQIINNVLLIDVSALFGSFNVLALIEHKINSQHQLEIGWHSTSALVTRWCNSRTRQFLLKSPTVGGVNRLSPTMRKVYDLSNEAPHSSSISPNLSQIDRTRDEDDHEAKSIKQQARFYDTIWGIQGSSGPTFTQNGKTMRRESDLALTRAFLQKLVSNKISRFVRRAAWASSSFGYDCWIFWIDYWARNVSILSNKTRPNMLLSKRRKQNCKNLKTEKVRPICSFRPNNKILPLQSLPTRHLGTKYRRFRNVTCNVIRTGESCNPLCGPTQPNLTMNQPTNLNETALVETETYSKIHSKK